MTQIVHKEFEPYGIAVVLGDRLMIEGIPKPDFKTADYFTDDSFKLEFPKLIKTCFKNVLNTKQQEIIIRQVWLVVRDTQPNKYPLTMADIVIITEAIFSAITKTNFRISNHAKIIVLPAKLYETLEDLTAKTNPQITKDHPDYYKNTSAMLVSKKYIIIKERKIDHTMLVTLIHETGHMVTPEGFEPQKLEFYAYCMEYLGLMIFNSRYKTIFPSAKLLTSNGGLGVSSTIHSDAYKEATDYFNALLLQAIIPKSP